MGQGWMWVRREKPGEWMAAVSVVEEWTSGGRLLLTWKAAGIETRYVAIFASSRAVPGAAIWFSPAIVPLAKKLLEQLRAEPAEHPPFRGAARLLFAGDPDSAWDLLSPPAGA